MLSLSFLNWIKNEMILYRISELMLVTLIQRYDKNQFILEPVNSRTRDMLKVYRLLGATFYDRINTIYQFIKPFLDNKMSIFEEYGAFIANVVDPDQTTMPLLWDAFGISNPSWLL